MDVKLPANRLEADQLVAASMERWDTGGRDQLAVKSSWLPSMEQGFDRSRNGDMELACFDDSGPAATAFPSLLTALLTSHLAHPRLLPGAYTAIFEALKKQQQSSVASAASSAASQNGASLAPVPETSEALVDAILDGIWAVDAELDARKDLSASTALWAAADGSKSTADIVARCRASLAQIVKELIQKQIIPRLTTAERLDLPLLKAVGLILDETGFQRKGVRMNTANLYKQQKFNLLREENEGYSGLINELISGMGPSIIPIKHDAVQASNGLADGEASKSTSDLPAQYRVVEQESVDARNARARRVMGNISALIGYFDLDPNRVLDVVMDVFSSNVVSHWPFFLALLSVSPWAPSHPDAQSANDDDIAMQDEESFIGPIRLDFSQDRGNSTVAQVLGFKYGFYQMPDTREETPDDLYFMTALMIKNSLIRFADLFPHLSPKEEGMKQLHQAYRKTLSARSASTTKANALTMAAALIEDGLHRPGGAGGAETEQIRQAEATASAKEPPNQVGGLLRALLAVGGLRHAVFILGRHPWLCSSLDGVAELYARLLRRVLEPATATISTAPLYEPDPRLAPKAPRSERESRSKGPPRPILSTNPMPQPKGKAASESKRGPELIPVFFYPIWDKELPGCEPKAVLTDFVPFLRLLGVNLAKDMELMKQVSRLTKVGLRMAMRKLEQDIASEEGRESKAAWLEVVRSLLLPALSCTYGDWDIAQEVWLIIHRLTYQERYALYGEWKYDLYRKPELKARQIATEREAKGILKRISSENVRQSAKDLATASHANPCIFLTVALNQVQAYDNLIAPIVECAKYLSELEYDVFTFILLDALSNPEKERTKQDGTNISLWLKSLSSFAGMLYRRHKEIDVGPVLQYMANQLKQDNSKDLVLIRELVLKMSGIEPLANLGDKQIAALTGGRLLRREAMMVANAQIGSDTRREFHDSGARLLLAMEASCMTIPLLILIAQQRQACIYLIGDDEGGLKYMGNAFDSCQETLFQYVEFLLTQLEPSAYSTLIPKLSDLYSRFSIEPAIAFHMARPRLLMAMKLADANQAEERLKAEVKAKAATKISSNEHSATPKDTRSLGEADDTAQISVESQAEGTVEPGQEKTDQAMEVEMTAVSPASTSLPGTKSVWRPGMEEAISAANEMLPAAVSAILGPHFFASFWQLSLSDIAVPIERYDVETNALQMLAKANDHERRGNLKTRDHALEVLSHLKAELKAQTLAHSATRRRLAVEKGHWFERAQLVAQLLEHCILPRALLSPTDAIFAGRFIRLMHANGTTNFSSLMTYDRIFVDHVAPIIFACTENEARNYARFLQQVLSDLSAWHVDEAVYAKEAVGAELPGFRPRWTIAQSLPWESFRQLFHKWHIALLQAFELCLASSEYMRLRNVIVVMTRIAQYFPLDEHHGKVLCLAVQKLVDEEDRGDLKVLGQGLLATLKKGQSAWLPVWKFKSDPPAQSAAAAAAEAERAVAKSAKDAKANVAPPAKASETTAAKSFNDTSPLPTRPKSNAPPMGPAADRGLLLIALGLLRCRLDPQPAPLSETDHRLLHLGPICPNIHVRPSAIVRPPQQLPGKRPQTLWWRRKGLLTLLALKLHATEHRATRHHDRPKIQPHVKGILPPHLHLELHRGTCRLHVTAGPRAWTRLGRERARTAGATRIGSDLLIENVNLFAIVTTPCPKLETVKTVRDRERQKGKWTGAQRGAEVGVILAWMRCHEFRATQIAEYERQSRLKRATRALQYTEQMIDAAARTLTQRLVLWIWAQSRPPSPRRERPLEMPIETDVAMKMLLNPPAVINVLWLIGLAQAIRRAKLLQGHNKSKIQKRRAGLTRHQAEASASWVEAEVVLTNKRSKDPRLTTLALCQKVPIGSDSARRSQPHRLARAVNEEREVTGATTRELRRERVMMARLEPESETAVMEVAASLAGHAANRRDQTQVEGGLREASASATEASDVLVANRAQVLASFACTSFGLFVKTLCSNAS
ncbi:hypothetical protein IE81DRAFT_329522 [Ceraceosorus guamensis]|uniref:THO complex subunit 2 n=1 Tax=Ceraceosorus guamensis TaxID=1522189 RepID=A0A316W112_9BASI|nr:hypothetical protein IE81DRAFT_329522 [Ceraceosorus guamensis]PWN43379.1 hypothetical protein IE81DRAFT_329522 [Ceraceosorus guamensis]